MKKSISVNKNSRGRPKKKGGVYPVSAVRLPPDLGDAVDQWAKSQADAPTRSEAIRRLVELGLSVDKPQAQTSARKAAKAKRMAGDAIDDLVDEKASITEQADRKRDLLSGPEEFRSVRVDHKKKR
jgi:hypothetical protein